MIYKHFNGIEISALGMGNMRLPVQNDMPGAPIDRKRAQAMIDFAMKSGINYFDTAFVYHNGESEKFLGEAMKKYPRESYYLASKFFIMASADYKAMFEEQLQRLQTDYIDFYLIHGIFDHTCQRYIDEGSIDYFLEQKAKGRIKYLGFSSHASLDNLAKFADHHSWDFAQIQINYYDWYFGNAKAEYAILDERNIPIVVMEPVRGGRLAALTENTEATLKDVHPEWSIASWAFKFLKNLDKVQVILSGMSTMEQLEDNVNVFSNEDGLSVDDMNVLEQVCTQFNSQIKVPCTACRYCVDDCPVEINIPDYLSVYNAYKVDGPWALNRLEHIISEGNPSDCISCGNCTGHCPQSIAIPEIMTEFAQIIESMPKR